MTLATIQQLVDDKLRSLTLGSLADPAVRDRAITQALLQYGIDSPQELVKDVAGVSTATLAVPADWVAGRSTLLAVEYPIGTVPTASLLQAAAQYDGSDWVIVLADALANATVRVHYTAPHLVDGTTVPAEHENAVACWAAAELCRQLATQKGHERDATISAAGVSGQSQSGDMARRAKEWLALYRTTLGLPDPDKAVAGGGQAAGTVVSWGRTRPRPRLSSFGV